MCDRHAFNKCNLLAYLLCNVAPKDTARLLMVSKKLTCVWNRTGQVKFVGRLSTGCMGHLHTSGRLGATKP